MSASSFSGKRWVKITLRTLHLVGTAGLGGAFLYQAPRMSWEPYLWLTVVSGFLLAFLELWSNGIWLIQLRGLAILAKLALLAFLPFAAGLEGPLLVAVIVISGVIAHAPASVRYFSVFHGRRIDAWREARK